MFDSALQSIASAVREAHTNPTEAEFEGVPVVYEDDSFHDETWDEWEPLLEEWMPRFAEAGYLDELKGIYIGDGFLEGVDSAGQYKHKEETIAFPQDPEYVGQPWLVGETKEYALIHEMTHHAHIRDLFGMPTSKLDLLDLNMRQHELDFGEKAVLFNDHVSEYAASNYLEAVAETCAGVTLGNAYPEEVREAYEELQGPEPLAEWQDPPKRVEFEQSSLEEMVDELVLRQNLDGTWAKETITYKVNADE